MTDFLWLWESQIAVRGTRPYCVGKLYLRAHLLPLSFADRVSKSFLPYLRASAAPELAIQFPREDRYGCPRTLSPVSEHWGVGSGRRPTPMSRHV